MALYDIVSGNTAVASDVEQLVNIFNGKHDIGNVSLAPQISAPSSANFSLASQSGSSLGVGAYNYEFTYVTGQYKSDGTTLVQTGETPVSAVLSITTTSGNTTVKVTLPTSGLPTSAIAINIYRTSVGGSDYKLVATIKTGSANYTDSTADASRGSQTPPTSNTTGTKMLSQQPYVYVQGGNISYSSASTYQQLPAIAGASGVNGTPIVNGFHYGVGTGNASDLVCDVAGTYLIMVWSTLSGLNNDVIYDLISRVYINSNASNYVDDSSGMVGYAAYSGEAGGNHGAPEGVYLIYQGIRTLGVNDLLRFYVLVGEAPRTVNKFAISMIKVS